MQAVLALAASWVKKGTQRTLTGTVIDSGDGVTHVIPVADGYVIGSCIRHIPLAGRDITNFVQTLQRDRKEPIPPQESLDVAKRTKEMHCYVCPDLVKEYSKYDSKPEKFIQQNEGTTKRGNKFTCEVGYERFLGPEVFFNPEMLSSDFLTPLPEVVDESILKCPIDVRRGLFQNIVLSGGSTMFKDFDRRLQRDIKKRVDKRIAANEERLKEQGFTSVQKAKAMDVEVIRVLSFSPGRVHVLIIKSRFFNNIKGGISSYAALRCVVRGVDARFNARVLSSLSYEGTIRRRGPAHRPPQCRFFSYFVEVTRRRQARTFTVLDIPFGVRGLCLFIAGELLDWWAFWACVATIAV